MYMLNMVIILIVMYSNVITAIDKIHVYLLHFNSECIGFGARDIGEDMLDGLSVYEARIFKKLR